MSKHALDWSSLKESLLMALTAIKANKLRSTLTLLGIVVGIFSIISVMTAMGVLRNSIEEGIMQLGANTFQVQKIAPGIGHGPGDERKYRNRKDITIAHAQQVHDKATLALAVGIESWEYGRVVVWKREKTNPNVFLAGENLEGITTNNWVAAKGRSYSAQDFELGTHNVILGKAVAEKLFPSYVDPIGEMVRIDGTLYHVIGVYETKGGVLGGNFDNFVTIPLPAYFEKYGNAGKSLHIMVTARSKEVFDDCIEQVRGILRAARHVPPGEEDDFGYFSNDSVINQFNEFTLYFRLGVLVIASIALLAAGIGIMNIMLVSVTERTREIGIRKAIGAQKKDILTQFIIEAVILCQIGGVIGVLIGILAGNGISLWLKTPPYMPWDWAAIGLGVCSLVGIIFGVYPAWKASTLDPIEALRYE